MSSCDRIFKILKFTGRCGVLNKHSKEISGGEVDVGITDYDFES